MTEDEALDEAAKAAGWGVWRAIRAHAKTIMENAALKAENERLTAILSEMNDTDIVARTMANFAVAREALEKVYSGAWIICRDDPLDVRIIARTALERIDNGDR